MNLIINNRRRISDLQKDFSEAFPFLKIEFFTKAHAYKSVNERGDIITGDKPIGSIRTNNQDGVIELIETRTVAEFEDQLRIQFGLFAQVFRKSGNVWIETSLTDEWTLGIQNKEGYELSRPISYKKYPDESSGMEQE